jgi:2-polyprenyl-3-methyl-5-hydroxy-6-metoxy-1,4-benzoquinol methylase
MVEITTQQTDHEPVPIATRRDFRMRVMERLLLKLSRAPGTGLYEETTDSYTLANALDFARKTVPGFSAYIRDRVVLDFGCGPGWQAVAMAREGARQVIGVDIRQDWIQDAIALAAATGVEDRTIFTAEH